ncbi:hypothetical protein CALCODRAFT_153599 [Calocera cornea HHB12733]|uniref:Copper acquisition factor BIM1-like domain-containing protein n=1 Tax=Calocera cornea HHB12733 TaxID=1353952 RepID=A0A165CMN8_9BASI|nr:hypothetical protein CALCODRAFT_153599 [Calocera cornea HHB12733]
MLSSLLVALAAAAAASAHFTLNYPQTRGFDEDLEPQFCGGFPQAQNRTPFPLGPAVIDITSHHPSAVIGAVISFDQNPLNFSEFNMTASGQPLPFLEPYFTISYQGEACFPVDVLASIPGVANGTNATIQVYFNGGDGELYQCSDVVLLTNYTVPSGTTCFNGTSPTGSSSTSPSSSPTTTPASGAVPQSVIAAGALGMVVSVAALALAL